MKDHDRGSGPSEPVPAAGQGVWERRHVFYEGRVQGVGFRYTARYIARRYNVSGYVRNLPDGRVELLAEGPPAELDRFLQDIRTEMSGYIRREEITTSPATGNFQGFEIRF
jgi:acylphosphatase